MKLDERVSQIIMEAAQAVFDADADLDVEASQSSPETVLVGDQARFDSMGFVNFVVNVEDLLHRHLNVRINLSDELQTGFPQSDVALTAKGLTSFLSELLQKRGVVAD